MEKLKIEALTFPSRAKRMIVYDQQTLIVANDFVLEVNALIKKVSESYDPIISHAKAEKKKYVDPLKESKEIVRLHIASYLEEQEKIRREAENKAKKEEEERQKKEEAALAEAKVLKDSGREEEAEVIVEEIPLPAKPPEPTPLKPEGLALKRIVDTERINQAVKDSSGLIKIPGIKIYPVWKWEISDRKLIPESYYKSIVSTRTEKIET